MLRSISASLLVLLAIPAAAAAAAGVAWALGAAQHIYVGLKMRYELLRHRCPCFAVARYTLRILRYLVYFLLHTLPLKTDRTAQLRAYFINQQEIGSSCLTTLINGTSSHYSNFKGVLCLHIVSILIY